MDALDRAAIAMGYREVKPKQRDMIVNLMSGKDVFAVLPTGYGKSFCFVSAKALRRVVRNYTNCLTPAHSILLGRKTSTLLRLILQNRFPDRACLYTLNSDRLRIQRKEQPSLVTYTSYYNL